MKIILSILAATMLIGLQGCASVTKGTKDTVQVQVSNCSEPMDCTASNKKGSWPFTAPGSVKFKKSDDDLNITCNDGGQIITQRLTPTRGGMIWGNVLIGGIIGGGVDALTDAHWNMTDSVIFHRNNCGQNNLTSSAQSMHPTAQEAQTTTQSTQPTAQKALPTTQSVKPTAQEAQTTTQSMRPTAQKALPTTQSVQTTAQEAQTTSQIVQPAAQEAQRNQVTSKPNYIVPPRPSSLRAVDARDKDDCELIMPITKNAGGTGDTSQFIKSAKNSAMAEAVNHGANSYFIVSTESNLYGASVTLEALKCK